MGEQFHPGIVCRDQIAVGVFHFDSHRAERAAGVDVAGIVAEGQMRLGRGYHLADEVEDVQVTQYGFGVRRLDGNRQGQLTVTGDERSRGGRHVGSGLVGLEK